jgi:hypothetical protein
VPARIIEAVVEDIEMRADTGNRNFTRNRMLNQIGNSLAGIVIALVLFAGQSDRAHHYVDRAFGFAHGMASKAAVAEGFHLARLEFDRLAVMVNGVVRVR